mmetsp:Transcript_21513/g.44849  ORF Transcript_21513/g.44849 Transcript_21513/m.44849 type:complete len:530 (+) Transcript_21513:73-1662(+)
MKALLLISLLLLTVCAAAFSLPSTAQSDRAGTRPGRSFGKQYAVPASSLPELRSRFSLPSSLQPVSEDVASDDTITVSPLESFLPRGDKLDRSIIKISIPAIANFAINPLIGAVDLYFVGQMGNALALAGQSASNQVFSSAFWIISFLPSVTTPAVARHYAAGEIEKAQDVICQALILGSILGLMGTAFLLLKPDLALSSVLSANAPALQYARPYLKIRALAFLPSLMSTVGFSAFRGTMDTVTPLKISGFANAFNAVLDPVLIFKYGWGVSGAAIATVVAEFISALSYFTLLGKAKLIRLKKILALPSLSTLRPLLAGGAAVQLRAVALNVVFLAVTRATQTLDKTGVAAAAHSIAIQVFNVGGIFLLALSTVAAFLVPSKIVTEGEVEAKRTVNRLMGWGLVLGSLLGAFQLLLLPFISVFTPLKEVQLAARNPSIIASVLQVINGLVFIGEGVMQGCGDFLQLAVSNIVAGGAMLVALKYFTLWWGLTGVWMSFGVFNGVRLAGVLLHQLRNGALANRNLRNTTNA